ncbi:lipoprotein-34 NlpB [Catenovulum agarivorans DS-2]|uniref:Lipoprotein-34 NlpB n=1 Tax=Catenovulum agarivorans DS-2 TaxID=1328313 RepID=W7QQ33_9ALTE|nr:outer membrane protein assembly factor BamC [Catenovulum agarivorans]EWH11067.1 lipoprotein-34 NlpB [Catenovulum agarivorans DS-2]
MINKSCHWIVSSVIAISLAGCAGKPNKADGSFAYQSAKPNATLKIPADKVAPETSSQFEIDYQRKLNGETGKQVGIFPPRLITPIVTASHIDDADPRTTIWFEQSEQIDNLEEAIWNAVSGYLAKQGVGFSKDNRSDGVAESDWLVVEREQGWGLWKSEYPVEQQKYRFWVKMKPHGRSGSLTVELIDRQSLFDEQDEQIFLLDDISLATQTLNLISGHFEYRLRLDAENRRTQYVKGVEVTTGQAPNGDPAVVVKAGYEHAWIRTIEALDYFGLLMTDVNKIQGRVHAKVKSDNSGFWATLFGDDEGLLGLEKGDYVIELIKDGQQTYIVFNDLTLTSITQAQIDKLLPNLQQRLGEDLD